MPDFNGLKLGKQKARFDKRTLKLSDYLNLAKLPQAPLVLNYADRVTDWGMMGNNVAGNCAIADLGHRILCQTTYSGKPFRPTDQQVMDAYSEVSGYDQKTGANDNGCTMLDVQRYMQQTGIGGHRIGPFVLVDHTKPAMLRSALWLFGGLDIGLWMPSAWEEASVWDVSRLQTGQWTAGSWGGHAVFGATYGVADTGEMEVVTWGMRQRLTLRAIARYADEVYTSISADWMLGGRSVSGFDAAALAADLRAVQAA